MIGKRDKILTVIATILFALFLWWADKKMDPYNLRILRLIPIYGIMAVSLNLINGVLGVLSLGHAGFVLIGAYTASLLTLTPQQKIMSFIIVPVNPIIAQLHTNFFFATIIGGIIAAAFAFLIGWPVFRLSGDYLAIASLGFAEIARIAAMNMTSITNGALGLKGLPEYSNIWWTWGWLLVTLIFMGSLMKSSYGRALKAIREDYVAAEAMGINVFRHQLWTFVIGAFFAGVAGSLYAHWLTTIDPRITTMGPLLTFYILIMIILGGLGSFTGSVLGAAIFAFMFEYLRFIEQDFYIFGIKVPGIPGMRMLLLSALFIMVMIFWPRGIMGRSEFSWAKFLRMFGVKAKEYTLVDFAKEGDTK